MTFKSEAHRRKFHELVKAGKIPKQTLAKWEEKTPPFIRLPERLTPKTPPKVKK